MQGAKRGDGAVITRIEQAFESALLQRIDRQVSRPTAVLWNIQQLAAGAAVHLLVQATRQATVPVFCRHRVLIEHQLVQLESRPALVFRNIGTHMRQQAVRLLGDTGHRFDDVGADGAVQVQPGAEAPVVIGGSIELVAQGAAWIVEEQAKLGRNAETIRLAVLRAHLHQVAVITDVDTHTDVFVKARQHGWLVDTVDTVRRRGGASDHGLQERLARDQPAQVIAQHVQVHELVRRNRLFVLGVRDFKPARASGRERQRRPTGAADRTAQV